MKNLHIVIGGVNNDDKDWLENKGAKFNLDSEPWVAPKSSKPGDDVIIYIAGIGFFATATVKDEPSPRQGWHNRYAARLTAIKLITPPILLEVIRQNIPELTWAIYPRSITTPPQKVANEIKKFIKDWSKGAFLKINEKAIRKSSISEIRNLALAASNEKLLPQKATVFRRNRSRLISRYALRRADGICEGCDNKAPFIRPDGSPYLVTHHPIPVSQNGNDHPENIIALCPNCHERAHHSIDAARFNKGLIKIITTKEKKLI